MQHAHIEAAGMWAQRWRRRHACCFRRSRHFADDVAVFAICYFAAIATYAAACYYFCDMPRALIEAA